MFFGGVGLSENGRVSLDGARLQRSLGRKKVRRSAVRLRIAKRTPAGDASTACLLRYLVFRIGWPQKVPLGVLHTQHFEGVSRGEVVSFRASSSEPR